VTRARGDITASLEGNGRAHAAWIRACGDARCARGIFENAGRRVSGFREHAEVSPWHVRSKLVDV
jgi:hypothetical protein